MAQASIERAKKEAQIQLLEEQRRLQLQKQELRASLRHLYGMPWYRWAWDFFQSDNKYNFLCAANQISKSSSMIRKCIHWATAKEIWPRLWPTRPTQFWYFYPDKGVGHVEYAEKWCKEWLPLGPSDHPDKGMRDWTEIVKKGAYHDHPDYGWKPTFKQGMIHSIVFNSGVTIYFKSYEQGIMALQTASVYAMFCDEELPEEMLPELNARSFSPTVSGYFHMVFTATIGQEIWRATIEEPEGSRFEKFPGAWKRQISMYECLTYIDGSLSPWTVEAIKEIEANCMDEDEVQRRVYGKFVVDKDRKYASFFRSQNVKKGHKLPKDWLVYSGIDYGSGGSAHPAAIVFVGVNPTFTKARVFRAWRGDKINTESSDILDKFLELKENLIPVANYYDWQAKDMKLVADRRHIPMLKADKDAARGEGLLNTLFKKDILGIYDETSELMKLVIELENLKNKTPKPKAKDDLIDALRFACMNIPWDFSVLNAPDERKVGKYDHMSEREKKRRGVGKTKNSGLDLLEAEMDLANEAYDYGLEGDFCGESIIDEDY